jgi:uncharacterized protein (DUF1778 family)
MARTALLIRCTKDEAGRIRVEAEKQRRTMSGYVLNIMVRAVDLEDRLFTKMNRYSGLNQVLSRRALNAPGPRTAVLVRCSVEEAERIRDAAKRRDIAINAFVLQSLVRSWNVQSAPPTLDAAPEAPPAVPPMR